MNFCPDFWHVAFLLYYFMALLPALCLFSCNHRYFHENPGRHLLVPLRADWEAALISETRPAT